MQMNEGLDTGDILTVTEVPIDKKETAESLFDKLSKAGAKLIIETLPKLEKGEVTPTPQEDSKSSYARIMHKSLGHIDWTKDAIQIERLVRGLNSWPSAYTSFNGKTVKLWSCDVVSSEPSDKEAGTIINVSKDYFDVACGNGVLRILELQLEGKKRMDTKSFLLGNQWKVGMRFE
jgi:methionyl-tRNA formyltransferase